MVDDVSLTPPRPGQYAGFVSRLAAASIDLLVLNIVIGALAAYGQFLADALGSQRPASQLLSVIAAGLGVPLYLVYSVAFIALVGQTPGKRIMGVRVVMQDGGRVSWRCAAGRFLGYILSMPLFWGYLRVLLDDERRAFHDKFAGTYVIYYQPVIGGNHHVEPWLGGPFQRAVPPRSLRTPAVTSPDTSRRAAGRGDGPAG